MSVEEKFRAAVNVIRSLPKDGAFQPSHELMLRFYAYFKQATEGPCKGPRPKFWEVVKKVKHDAWAKLGNMPAEEAMKNYVEELRQIAETMSYTDNVAKFMGSLDSVYDSVPVEDLELLLGPTIERMRSMPGSPINNTPLGSRETSPSRVPASRGAITKGSSLETSPASSGSASSCDDGGDGDEDEDEEEEFIDTVEVSEYIPEKKLMPSTTRVNHVQTNGIPHHKQNGDISHYAAHGADTEVQERGRPRERSSPPTRRRTMHPASENSDITDQIRDVVQHLQRDLDRITTRVRSLEVSALSRVPETLSSQQYDNLVDSCGACEDVRRHAEFLYRSRSSRQSSWWPFSDLSPRSTAFILTWPIVVHLFILWLQRRRALLATQR